MSEPFLSEIKIVGFNYAPKNWALCNGQTLAIAQNQALFALLGTTYGGNGVTTFLLPNLQGRVPLGTNNFSDMGTVGGQTTHTLLMAEMPAHSHQVTCDQNTAAASNSPTPANNTILGQTTGNANPSAPFNAYLYGTGAPQNVLAPQAVATVGTNSPHDNMQPYLVLCFAIALTGIFPSRN